MSATNIRPSSAGYSSSPDSPEKRLRELETLWSAINRITAIIEFTPEGIILDANDNFLKTVGYSREQVKGQHHRIFCKPEYAQSSAYQNF